MSNRVWKSILKDESKYTPWGRSYRAWNGKSPEVEWVDMLAGFARTFRPAVTIETGVGQGFITRFVVAACPKRSAYYAVESEDKWRSEFVTDDPRVTLMPAMPVDRLPNADLVLLDSRVDLRIQECNLWRQHGKPGSVCFIHDVSDRHHKGTIHRKLHEYCRTIDQPQIPLRNPRGGVLLLHS